MEVVGIIIGLDVHKRSIHVTELKEEGSGVNEVGISNEGRTLVKVSREFFGPPESDNYRADYTKAKKRLGWAPKTMFKDLIDIMVRKDTERYP